MSPALLILSICLPLIILGSLFYLLTKKFVENEQKKALLELRTAKQNEALKTVMPIRMQSYERLVLFLDRMNPNNLVLRCYQPGMSLKLLQGVMVKNLRDEFDHNLSQQIYISSQAWDMIKTAKEEMIHLINTVAVQLPADANPNELAGIIFQAAAKNDTAAEKALIYLKQEFREQFS